MIIPTRSPVFRLAAVVLLCIVVDGALNWLAPVPTGRRAAVAQAREAPPLAAVRSDVPAAAALVALPARPTVEPEKINTPAGYDLPAAMVPAHDESDYLQTHSEDVCVALVVYAEARGEPLEGKIAVADLVLNRMQRHAGPVSPCEVTREAGQFAIGGQAGIARPGLRDDAWRWCLFAATSVLRDRYGVRPELQHADATHGALCMVSPANMPADARTWPAWAHETPVAIVGGHAFFACSYSP